MITNKWWKELRILKMKEINKMNKINKNNLKRFQKLMEKELHLRMLSVKNSIWNKLSGRVILLICN